MTCSLMCKPLSPMCNEFINGLTPAADTPLISPPRFPSASKLTYYTTFSFVPFLFSSTSFCKVQTKITGSALSCLFFPRVSISSSCKKLSMKEEGILLSPLPLRPLPSLPPPPPPPSPPLVNFENRITPSILLIIVILAVVFFISGLLHLLVRYLLRSSNREPDAVDGATAFQGELQQLFHLHDAGVDQSFIDALPVFLYKSITGVKDPFDCAVCLCEFEPEDKLRLLPKCSHAFHLQCIDTWLLSHSTCPLCRRSLLYDLSPSCSPMVLVLESGGESSSEVGSERRDSVSADDIGISVDHTAQKPVEVKLGKFRSVEVIGGGEGQGSGSSSNLDQRRCFSMGAYEYVMEERSSLRVTIKPTKKKPAAALKKPGHRVARSECDCLSKREGFKGFEASRTVELGGDARFSASARLSKKESFSISKIWMRGREEEAAEDTSLQAVSFRLPPAHCGRGELKLKQSRGESDWDVEVGSCNSGVVSRVDESPSFARRSLLWIVGRQNKLENHY